MPTASEWKVKVDDGAKSGDELIAWQYLAEIIVDLAACEKERDEAKLIATDTGTIANGLSVALHYANASAEKAEARVKVLEEERSMYESALAQHATRIAELEELLVGLTSLLEALQSDHIAEYSGMDDRISTAFNSISAVLAGKEEEK